MTQTQLLNRSEPDARFDRIPESMNEAREYDALKQDLVDYLYRNSSLKLLYSPALKEYSRPNEDERDFRARLNQAAREQRDQEVDELNDRYAKRLQTLNDRLRRAQATVARKQADAEARKREVMVSVGESVLGMFIGRRSIRSASTAMSKYRQKSSAEMGAQQAHENMDALQKEVNELQKELQNEANAITTRWDSALQAYNEVPIRPNRNDIEVDLVALAWAPNWQITYRDRQGIVRTEVVRAYY
jgi:hypothetical protein